ncbi:ABC1-domain-containing protein [Metschnikowia bicuspidata var. bicuspidata NRRL YB-4993]|uniref:ABC1-domain-containing protein n=1 Tax=Metschnikowia bicuspidata var. bicuspidata NRRL YB-4993 TaxID=869754 RepID=A0A1A0H8G2_9ASCO|nr:ABC1-domain-containing protein [Metschnikowia bicuspidata var. bicuspidata NRRL YB-4993]OBA20275.1 ABC1-domain-containing protein [Metschnikowia bicuspidata var. bicuspidata NRRL YB-4993]
MARGGRFWERLGPRIHARSLGTTRGASVHKYPASGHKNPASGHKNPAGHKTPALGPWSPYVVDEYYYASVAQRSIRAVAVLSLVAYKYARSDAASMEQLHEECAELIFGMIARNKGLYVKLGQAIANQGALFPAAYQARFARLYDGAPADPWEATDATLRRAWGPHYQTQLFEHFERQPMASALIAQVHRARLKHGGAAVAVKVQHPYISRQIHADLAVYRLMARVYSRVFGLPLDFAAQYVSDQLATEADFTHECRNSQRLAACIAADASARSLAVHVPDSYPQYAARQVLVTEWIDGIPLTDRRRLVAARVCLRRLMTQYLSIFAKQIFDYGFVHSDPHPGNILVRLRHGTQQMVILDHGLYIELAPRFQAQYGSLWRSVLALDRLQLAALADAWGIGSPDLLQAIVQLRPPAAVRAENAPSSADLLRMLLADRAKFPPDLLFLLRTMRMMQNLNQSMGSPVNRINLLTEVSLQSHLRSHASWADVWRYATVRVSLVVSNLVFWLFRARQILLGDRYGDRGEGLEDYIDKYMKESARAIGIHFGDAA